MGRTGVSGICAVSLRIKFTGVSTEADSDCVVVVSIVALVLGAGAVNEFLVKFLTI